MGRYFAYGSNLHAVDLAAWCAARGRGAPRLRAVGPAWLPDAEVCFRYRSRGRGCGTLDFRERRGSVVPGVLFEVDQDADWTVLDRKEGTPNAYRRCEKIVLAEDGSEHRATTYEVIPDLHEGFVAPSDEYLRIVREGLASHGMSDAHILAAAKNDTSGSGLPLLVYGTLRQGESRHGVLVRHGARLIGEAYIQGVLFDLGGHPGFQTSPDPHEIKGELYEFPDVVAALAETDRIEGFRGFGATESLYRRTLLPVRVGDVVRRAWAYLFARHPEAAHRIPSGDWKRR